MTPRSLRFRLLAAAVVSVAAALLIAGVSLILIFEHHVEQRIGTELETYLDQITASVGVTNQGRIAFRQDLADPRFDKPLSGLYWQIQDEAHPTLLRSRSLWDSFIELPQDELTLGTIHRHLLPGPAGQTLLVRERQFIFQPDTEQRRVRIAVAVDKQSLIAARNAFAKDMLPYLAVIAVVLLAAAWIQVRIGLAPLDSVRRGVTEIRSGTTRRLGRAYPDEVMPLIDEMNALLDAQEQAIERARAWTADLAHGLKTPLMVLTADAQRLREQGNASIADDLDQLAETMRGRVDRELIRARVRSGTQTRRARADVRETLDRVVRTLKRSPSGAALGWSVEAPEKVDAAILADDLTELLGNILENSAKWASETVSVSVSVSDDIVIRVEDDGMGVPDDQLDNLGLRGVRLDEQKQGSGLGLAIARDIAEAYHGDLSFSNRPEGGLAVVVRLRLAT
ncbi:MAG: HAMP domain-containing histidine kinase [Candidatus Thiodiazotropha sp. (ex. Lucinisca nassula)]|nr:HAMP domain-containing histidine kinase [Candidatus Thiodiazotropha sp. (ex. Lucinisca nassula)]